MMTNESDENILTVYLKEISLIPLLTREEEDRYARLAAEGDATAKKHLIESNLRFVVNVSKKYQNQGLPLLDLISEGNIGLMTAVEKFDISRGYHFISYAIWWIKQAILKAIYEKARMIRLPLNRSNELAQIEKAKKELQDFKGMEPDSKGIADFLDMKLELVEELLSISKEPLSLESSPFSKRGIEKPIEDFKSSSPDDLLIEKSLKEEINEVLKTLTDKESEILQCRFGLNGKIPLSLERIGEKFGLTKERVRQIEKKAIRRLRHPNRSRFLEAYMEEAK